MRGISTPTHWFRWAAHWVQARGPQFGPGQPPGNGPLIDGINQIPFNLIGSNWGKERGGLERNLGPPGGKLAWEPKRLVTQPWFNPNSWFPLGLLGTLGPVPQGLGTGVWIGRPWGLLTPVGFQGREKAELENHPGGLVLAPWILTGIIILTLGGLAAAQGWKIHCRGICLAGLYPQWIPIGPGPSQGPVEVFQKALGGTEGNIFFPLLVLGGALRFFGGEKIPGSWGTSSFLDGEPTFGFDPGAIGRFRGGRGRLFNPGFFGPWRPVFKGFLPGAGAHGRTGFQLSGRPLGWALGKGGAPLFGEPF